MRRNVQHAGDVLDTHSLGLHQLSRHRIHGKLLVLDAILEERSLEVRSRSEMRDKLLVCVVAEVSIGFENGLDVSALLVELSGKLLLSERLSNRHRIIDNGIDSDDTIQRHLHEVEHVVGRISSLEELEVRVRDGHLEPFATVRHADLHARRMNLMQGNWLTFVVALDDGVCVTPSLEPAYDSHPECHRVRIVIRMMENLVDCVLTVRRSGTVGVKALHRLRKRRDILRDETNSGKESRKLQGRVVCHIHAEINVVHVWRQRRTVCADADATQPCAPPFERSGDAVIARYLSLFSHCVSKLRP